jgi:hypothetical protein
MMIFTISCPALHRTRIRRWCIFKGSSARSAAFKSWPRQANYLICIACKVFELDRAFYAFWKMLYA